MLCKRFTRQGISKLTRLQGKFCKCDIVVQVFLEDYPMGGDEPEPIREYNTIVSDATNCFPAIFNDSGLEIYRGLMTVVCVTEALCCISPSGYTFFPWPSPTTHSLKPSQNILIINAFQPVRISPEFAFSLPHRVCVPDLDGMPSIQPPKLLNLNAGQLPGKIPYQLLHFHTSQKSNLFLVCAFLSLTSQSWTIHVAVAQTQCSSFTYWMSPTRYARTRWNRLLSSYTTNWRAGRSTTSQTLGVTLKGTNTSLTSLICILWSWRSTRS